jgi:hypothetical protein
MRTGLLYCVSSVLLGANLTLAQAQTKAEPIAPASGKEPVPAAKPADEPGKAAPQAELGRSPYWPNPLWTRPDKGSDKGLPAAKTMDESGKAAPQIELGRSPYWPHPSWTQPDGGSDNCLPAGVPPLGPPRPERVWVYADDLLWFVKAAPSPAPLVTTATAPSFGTLGLPTTTVLFGGTPIDYGAFTGGRFGAGFWCDYDHRLGLESSGFLTEFKPARSSAISAAVGTPVLARPVINAVSGLETIDLISAPGIAAGRVDIGSSVQFYGWELNATSEFVCQGNLHVDGLLGYRFLSLHEDLDVIQRTTVLPGGIAGPPGVAGTFTGFGVFDHFATRDRFNGGQIGGRMRIDGEYFFVAAEGKLALGASHEQAHLVGATSESAGGGPANGVPGGLLVVSSNSGRYTQDRFAVVPEIGVRVGYRITSKLSASIGYTFLYWSDVARPGDQINRTVNPALVPISRTFGTLGGPAQPSFTFQHSDFWAQGLNFGLEFRF